MPGGSESSQPWERREGESGAAFEGFQEFVHAGPTRSIAATARKLGKRRQLLCRWARRHEWRARALAWDRAQQRQEEAMVQEAREEMLRRRLRHARQLEAIAFAILRALVHRDPETGEVTLLGEVRPQDAASLLRLAAYLQDHSPLPADGAGAGGSMEGELRDLSDRELRRLLELARRSAQTPNQEADDATPQT
jgi:hypothetical protein